MRLKRATDATQKPKRQEPGATEAAGSTGAAGAAGVTGATGATGGDGGQLNFNFFLLHPFLSFSFLSFHFLLMNVLRTYERLLRERPLLVSSLSSGVLFGLGDVLSQLVVEQLSSSTPSTAAAPTAAAPPPPPPSFDVTRTARAAFFGTFVAVFILSPIRFTFQF